MSIYHFFAKPIQRSNGRSSTAAAAYISCSRILDQRTGEVHDYRKKSGLCGSEVILPGGTTTCRDELWNRVESKHSRGDAVVAREFEIALPHELTIVQNMELTGMFSRTLADLYEVAVDFNIHAKETTKTDNHGLYQSPHHPDNIHTHMLLSACHVDSFGELGKKCLELDPIHCGRAGIFNPMQLLRPIWQDLFNLAMARAGHAARVDHRTLEEQGIDRRPGYHLGPCASAIERAGKSSWIRDRENARAEAEKAEAAADAAAESMSRQAMERLEKELDEARALELAPRARTQPEVASELTLLLTELARVDAFLLAAPSLTQKAPTALQLAAARKDAAPAAKRASHAKLKLVVLADELSGLGWWQPFRKSVLGKDLLDARRTSDDLENRASILLRQSQTEFTKEDVFNGILTQKIRHSELSARCRSLQDELQSIAAWVGSNSASFVSESKVTQWPSQGSITPSIQKKSDPPVYPEVRYVPNVPDEINHSLENERPR